MVALRMFGGQGWKGLTTKSQVTKADEGSVASGLLAGFINVTNDKTSENDTQVRLLPTSCCEFQKVPYLRNRFDPIFLFAMGQTAKGVYGYAQ